MISRLRVLWFLEQLDAPQLQFGRALLSEWIRTFTLGARDRRSFCFFLFMDQQVLSNRHARDEMVIWGEFFAIRCL